MDKVNIYKIKNLINGKVYIGQAKNVSDRWKKHKENATKKINRYLYDAMNKYGYKNFSVETVDICSYSKRNTKEKYWIKYFCSDKKDFGYNMTAGGDGGFTWKNSPHRKEIGEKISLANTGKKRDEAFREKMRKVAKNRPPMSEKTRKKISESLKKANADGKVSYVNNRMRGIKKENHPMYGKKHSLESRLKIGGARLGKTYEEIFGKEKAEELKEKKRKEWTGKNNPSYKKRKQK